MSRCLLLLFSPFLLPFTFLFHSEPHQDGEKKKRYLPSRVKFMAFETRIEFSPNSQHLLYELLMPTTSFFFAASLTSYDCSLFTFFSFHLFSFICCRLITSYKVTDTKRLCHVTAKEKIPD